MNSFYSFWRSAFKNSQFTPQLVPSGYTSSYFTYAVESPYSNLQDWKKFHDDHIKNGGDDFYASMILGYNEPIMKKLGYSEKYKGKCPVAERIQPTMMQFKTNYRDLSTAKKNIDVLLESIEKFE
mgnify:FL=1